VEKAVLAMGSISVKVLPAGVKMGLAWTQWIKVFPSVNR